MKLKSKFMLTLKYYLGKYNVVADALSRASLAELNNESVEEVKLFAIRKNEKTTTSNNSDLTS